MPNQIEQSILTGRVTALPTALTNDYGIINVEGTNYCFYNYNGNYDTLTLNDEVNFFHCNIADVVSLPSPPSNLINNVLTFNNTVAFNIKSTRGFLVDAGTSNRTDPNNGDATHTDLPPGKIMFKGNETNIHYIFTDLVKIHMVIDYGACNTWDRIKIQFVDHRSQSVALMRKTMTDNLEWSH